MYVVCSSARTQHTRAHARARNRSGSLCARQSGQLERLPICSRLSSGMQSICAHTFSTRWQRATLVVMATVVMAMVMAHARGIMGAPGSHNIAQAARLACSLGGCRHFLCRARGARGGRRSTSVSRRNASCLGSRMVMLSPPSADSASPSAGRQGSPAGCPGVVRSPTR
jgi:hypothetical protein